jgi:hypothetical protein
MSSLIGGVGGFVFWFLLWLFGDFEECVSFGSSGPLGGSGGVGVSGDQSGSSGGSVCGWGDEWLDDFEDLCQ